MINILGLLLLCQKRPMARFIVGVEQLVSRFVKIRASTVDDTQDSEVILYMVLLEFHFSTMNMW